MELTISQMKKLYEVAEAAGNKVKKLRDEVKSLIDVSPEEASAVQYILNQLEQTVASNERTDAFIREKGWSLVYPTSGSMRTELFALLETTFSDASKTDVTQINITGEQSYAAAEALFDLFETLQSMVPEERIATVQAALNHKIKAYQLEMGAYVLSDPSSPIKDLFDLNEYIKAEHKKIAQEANRETRLSGYQRLKDFTEKERDKEELSKDEETAYSFLDYLMPPLTEPWQDVEYGKSADLLDEISEAMLKEYIEEGEETLKTIADIPEVGARLEAYQKLKESLIARRKELAPYNTLSGQFIDTISESMTKEVPQITGEFDILTDAFKDKLDNLDKRSRKITDPIEKNKYTKAITEANALIGNLQGAKKEFVETSNFKLFKQQIASSLNEFEGHAALEENRSEPWFRQYVSAPFENLKEKLNQLIQRVQQKLPGKTQSSNAFFKPPETGTKRKFEEYQEGLEHLGEEQETKRSKKN
ncbi:MAG: hypothetical protein K0U37_07255 [Gammaproteobacteria bacterium]|nr:hypothetical protein [Gammaproteobacteria bacterium]